MKTLSLKDRLMKYMLSRHTQFIPSGELQRLVVLHTKHTPRSAVRRLQELCEEGRLERVLIKNHTHYRAKLASQQNQTNRETILAQNREALQYFDSYPVNV